MALKVSLKEHRRHGRSVSFHRQWNVEFGIVVVASLLLLSSIAYAEDDVVVYVEPDSSATPSNSYSALLTVCRSSTVDPNSWFIHVVNSTKFKELLVVAMTGSETATNEGASTMTSVVYIGGRYSNNAWMWDDGVNDPVVFGTGASCTPVTGTVNLNWAPGYPVLASTGGIDAPFLVYNRTQDGWMNVDGTQRYDGVACMGILEPEVTQKKNIAWWAILLIVVAALAVVGVVIVVICCCCRSDKKYDDNDDEGEWSGSTSRSSAADASSFVSGSSRSFGGRGYASSKSSVSHRSGFSGANGSTMGDGASNGSSISSRSPRSGGSMMSGSSAD